MCSNDVKAEGPRHVRALATTACALLLVSGATAVQQTRPQPPMAPAGETGRRVTDEGLLANYFPARAKAPALLMLGGSVGGLSPEVNNAAKALQAEGFAVLHLSYFRGPGQNPRLELVPLEYFSTALRWLGRQPEADATRMGIVGGSKGAEAALLVASRHPELKAVLVYMPSSVVWPGIGSEDASGPISSSWSEHGKPIPYLPNPPYDPRKGGTMADDFRASLTALPKHPEAVIPVERISAPLLLVCGQADRIWPSCPMAQQIQQRLAEQRRPAATLLAYDDAGHLGFGVPFPPDVNDPRVANAGGTAQGTSAARADSWPKAIAFLKSALER
jgi:uncharacterized protein